MSQYAVELCEVVIQEFFGECCATVCHALLNHGRMTLQTLRSRTKLPLKKLRQALVSLMRHHLVLYAKVIEHLREVTHYEAQWTEIYNFVRKGKAVYIISQRVSQEAGSIAKYIATQGRVRVSDIFKAFGKDPDAVDDETNKLRNEIYALMEKKFLDVVQPRHLIPMFDQEMELRLKHTERLKSENMSDAKRNHEIQDAIQLDLAKLDAAEQSKEVGMKRKPIESFARPSKRRRRAGAADETADGDDFVLVPDPDALLAERRIGKTTSIVYSHVLSLLETKTAGIPMPNQHFFFTTMELSRHFKDDIDLVSCIVKDSSLKTLSVSNPVLIGEDDEDDEDEDEDVDMDAEAADESKRDRKAAALLQHLELLADSSLRFLTKTGTRAMGEWMVDYTYLSTVLREIHYENIIEQKLGDQAKTLLRIIKDKGKIAEQQLSNLALLRQKDIRAHLTSMCEVGALDIQEVPRSADRAPSKTFYLWFHRTDRAYSLLLDQLFKSMVRVLRRLRSERDQRSLLLQKVERSNVQGNEEKYLQKFELADLKKLGLVEQQLLVQLARLDELVMLFGDF
ncbi:DNA-directed RNA polymerase III complex subunit Rpc82 [Schizosaccharomyces japonicus yFS275]|uniref:DNA-directed RNA polymerase III subunit RPC3 n=1 Tax=Schizosaccharomyces japonicus (strain yFS275 / FY16936) TaxID=402676 RepID=B6JW50_SCHJY|nr:DNA-directed RNA polymerase III complex subunit Rpc82 [Schizosaccharomyces japonicus yFS275]EEB05601.2 DNA-directed RNA polymerase III complex subunit Rpc82 [Schizosaccharomyces japonicus yFS275]